MSKIEIIRKYFSFLESFETDQTAFETLLHADFKQTEFPNLLNPKGQESDLQNTIKRAIVGGKMLSRQKFEITNAFENGEQIVVEAAWYGRMAMDAGPLKSGAELKARFCIVCEFSEGKIIRQRNYDCFEQFQ